MSGFRHLSEMLIVLSIIVCQRLMPILGYNLNSFILSCGRWQILALDGQPELSEWLFTLNHSCLWTVCLANCSSSWIFFSLEEKSYIFKFLVSQISEYILKSEYILGKKLFLQVPNKGIDWEKELKRVYS